MQDFDKYERNRVRRLASRGQYDRKTIFEILDAGFVCHVGFVIETQPYVIPTLYGRDGNCIYLHGSPKSRMLRHLADGFPICLTVTHVDGLVLARSAFHHSINYRSAVLFGTAQEVSREEKVHALFVISEQILKGRWAEAREPNDRELRATTVLKVTIDDASAKIRTGPPVDDAEDLVLPAWAGVVPFRCQAEQPIPDPLLGKDTSPPKSVQTLFEK